MKFSKCARSSLYTREKKGGKGVDDGGLEKADGCSFKSKNVAIS